MEVNAQLHTPAALPTEKEPLVPIEKEAVRAPEPVSTWWWREKNPLPTPTGNRTPVIQTAAQSLL
jgi:hypothetical protein